MLTKPRLVSFSLEIAFFMAGILLTTKYRFLNPDISFACHGFIPSFVSPHSLLLAVFHCFQIISYLYYFSFR